MSRIFKTLKDFYMQKIKRKREFELKVVNKSYEILFKDKFESGSSEEALSVIKNKLKETTYGLYQLPESFWTLKKLWGMVLYDSDTYQIQCSRMK